MNKPQRQSVIIDGPVGEIEAVLETPAEQPVFRAIICHPHPLFGGTMENKVVTTLARGCRDAGGVVMRFNFRGVGGTAGVHSGGLGETEDLLALEAWMHHEYPDLPLWLAGFSFGSYVAAMGARALADNERPAKHLMLVAPPVHNNDFSVIESTRCPVTVVQGDEDEVVPVEEVLSWVEQTTLTPDLIRFPGTGHFFHGHLPELKALVADRIPS